MLQNYSNRIQFISKRLQGNLKIPQIYTKSPEFLLKSLKNSSKIPQKASNFDKISRIFFGKTFKVSNSFKRCLKILKNLKTPQNYSKNSNNRKKAQEYLKITSNFRQNFGIFTKFRKLANDLKVSK